MNKHELNYRMNRKMYRSLFIYKNNITLINIYIV